MFRWRRAGQGMGGLCQGLAALGAAVLMFVVASSGPVAAQTVRVQAPSISTVASKTEEVVFTIERTSRKSEAFEFTARLSINGEQRNTRHRNKFPADKSSVPFTVPKSDFIDDIRPDGSLDISLGVTVITSPEELQSAEVSFPAVPGRLTLIKRINPGTHARGGIFEFTVSGATSHKEQVRTAGSTSGGFSGQIARPIAVPAGGTVRVTEDPLFALTDSGGLTSHGFTAQSASCSNGEAFTADADNAGFTVTVPANTHVECEIVSSAGLPRGELILIKDISPGPHQRGGTFTFDLSGDLATGDSGQRVLRAIKIPPQPSGVNYASPRVSPRIFVPANGTITVTERDSAGFEFKKASCRSGAKFKPNFDGRSFTVDVPSGVTVTCVISNDALEAEAPPPPTVTIAPPADIPANAPSVTFTLTSSRNAPSGGLDVTVDLPGNTVRTSETVRIDGGTRTATLTVPRSEYAATDGALSIDANLVDGDAYDLGAPATATATIPILPAVGLENPVTLSSDGMAATVVVFSDAPVPNDLIVELRSNFPFAIGGQTLRITIPAQKKRGSRKLTRSDFGARPDDAGVGPVTLVLIPLADRYVRSSSGVLGVTFELAPLPPTVTITPPADIPANAPSVTFTLTSSRNAPSGGLDVTVDLPGNTVRTSETVRIDGGTRTATLTVPRSEYAATDGALSIDANLVDDDAYDLGDRATATATIPILPAVGLESPVTLSPDGMAATVVVFSDAPVPNDLIVELRSTIPFAIGGQTLRITIPAQKKRGSRKLTRSDFGAGPDDAGVGPVTLVLIPLADRYVRSSSGVLGVTFELAPPPPTVTIAPPADIPANAPSVTFTLTSSRAAPSGGLDVTVELPGNTVRTSETVRIGPNTSTATLTVPRSEYAATDGALSIDANLVDGDAYDLGAPATATATIPILPAVGLDSVTLSPDGTEMTVTVIAVDPVPNDLTVDFRIEPGLAVGGSVLSITIPAQKQRGSRTLTASDFRTSAVRDDGGVGPGTLTLILRANRYVPAPAGFASFFARFELAPPPPPPTVTIAPPTDIPADAPSVTFTLTSSRDAPSGGLDVTVDLPGNTVRTSETVRIDGGTRTATLTVLRSEYAATDGALSIDANLVDGDAYDLGAPATATATIPVQAAPDLPVITLENGHYLGQSVFITVRSDRKLTDDLEVFVDVLGVPSTRAVKISAGTDRKTVLYPVPEFTTASVYEQGVSAEILKRPTYTLGSPASLTIPPPEFVISIAKTAPTKITHETTSVTFRISITGSPPLDARMLLSVSAGGLRVKSESVVVPANVGFPDYTVDKTLFTAENYASGDVRGRLKITAALSTISRYLLGPDLSASVTIPAAPGIQPRLTLTKQLDVPAPRESSFDVAVLGSNGGGVQTDETVKLTIPKGEVSSAASREIELFPQSQGIDITDHAVAGFTPQKAECTVNGEAPTPYPLSAANRKFTLPRPQLGQAIACTLFSTVDAAPPLVTIAPPAEDIPADATSVVFTLTSSRNAPSGGLDVTVDLPGNTADTPRTVTILENRRTATLDVSRSDYPETDEDLPITATVADGDAYDLGDPASATATIPASPPGTLTLTKHINAGPHARRGSFTFDLTGVSSDPVPLAADIAKDAGAKTYYISKASDPITVPAGTTVTIAEQPHAGFTPRAAECTVDGKTTAYPIDAKTRAFAVTVASEQAVDCTIFNDAGPPPPSPLPGTLTLIKHINAGPHARSGSFVFDLTGVTSDPIPLAADIAKDAGAKTYYISKASDPITVPAGTTVTIAEQPHAGFTPDVAECAVDGKTTEYPIDAETRAFAVTVASGQAVECTIFNDALEEKVTPLPGTLTLIKQINEVNARGGTFTFQLSGAAAATIKRTAVATQVGTKISYVSPASDPIPVSANGTVTVEEAPAEGFNFNTAICSNGDTPVAARQTGERRFDVDVAAGAAVQCIVVNDADAPPPPEPPAAPTLTLRTISNGGTSTFRFSGAGAASFTNLAIRTTRKGEAAASRTMTAAAGPVRITQAPTRGFTFVSAGCRLGDAALGTVDQENRAVALELPQTGAVVCTFVNRGESARTATLIWNFLKRRVEALTGDTGRSRLAERRQNAGRFAAGGLKDALGASGEGTGESGKIGVRTSLSKLGGALGDAPASVKASRLGVNAADYGVSDGVGYRSGWDVWTEASWNYRRSDGGRAGGPASSGQFGLLRGGVDYLVSPNLLVGVLVQYDYLSDESKARGRGDGYEISGHGWMAGPYVEVALSKNLTFDGRALWGTSRNTVSPDLTFTDTFTTERWLASARLTGSWTWSPSANSTWHFAPTAEVVWFDERSAGFTNALGVDIDSQHASLGRFKAGPEISYRHRMSNGTVIEPRLGAQALWRFTGAGKASAPGLDTASSDALADVPLEKFQMRFEGGLKIELPKGTRVELEGAYTGLGREGQEAIGGKVGITIPLQ